METNNYNKLVDKEVIKFYRTTNIETESDINKEAAKLKLDNRIKQLAKLELFIKLKDHKEHADY